MEEGHYHSHVRIVKRSDGRSAVAAAAYRSGEKLKNDYEQRYSDFTHRSGVLHTEIMAPDGAPDWVYDRTQLWNTAEKFEKHPRAQLAREVELALPHQLSDEQRLALLHAYVNEHFVSKGMVADVAIHRGHTDKRNVHAHVMLTMRELLPDGFGNKVRSWNDKANVMRWREAWARDQNRALKEAGHEVFVDHRSYKERNDDRLPQIHEGPKARKMHNRGFHPRSRMRAKYHWDGKPLIKMNYPKIDQGRSRVQRNIEVRWRNRILKSSGKRMANAVSTHLHHKHFNEAWNNARQAGQQLKNLGADYRRTKEKRQATQISVSERYEQLAWSIRLRTQWGVSSGMMDVFLTYQLQRLERAKQEAIEIQERLRAKQRQLRRTAVQYRNLKSQLGGQARKRHREQVRREHTQAMRHVTPYDIWRSNLSERQKREMNETWERARDRDRTF